MNEIKNYWDKQAEEKGHLKNATVNDYYFRDLEVYIAKKYLSKDNLVLDVGCGNGQATLDCSCEVFKCIGVDYSEKMVEKSIGNMEKRGIKNVEFYCQDATNLKFGDGFFDVVIMSRVLINIPQLNLQTKAIDEATRVLKPNGLFLLLEPTKQGHKQTDMARKKFGLPALKKHWHNDYIDELYFGEYLQKYFILKETHRFSLYMLISKLLYPKSIYPKEPSFLSEMNRFAMEISKNFLEIEGRGIGHNLMWILQKKNWESL